MALATWSGVSEFVRICRVRKLSAIFISASNCWKLALCLPSSVFSTSTCTTSEGAVFTSPANTSPLVPSMEMNSPFLSTTSPAVTVFAP